MDTEKEYTSIANETKIDLLDLESPLDVVEWSECMIKRFNSAIANQRQFDFLLIPYNNSLKTQLKFCHDRQLLQQEILKHIKFFSFYYFSRSKVREEQYELMEYVLMVYCSLAMEATQKKVHTAYIMDGCKVAPLEERLIALLLSFYKDRKHHVVNILLKMRFNAKSKSNVHVMQALIGHVFFNFPLDVFTDTVFCGTYILYYKLKEIGPEGSELLKGLFHARFHQQMAALRHSRIAQTLFLICADSELAKLEKILFFNDSIVHDYFKYLKNMKPTPEKQPQPSPPVNRIMMRRDFLIKPPVIDVIDIDEDESPKQDDVVIILSDDDDDVVPVVKPPKRRKKMKQGCVDLTLDDDDDPIPTPSSTPLPPPPPVVNEVIEHKVNDTIEHKINIEELSFNAGVVNDNSPIVSEMHRDIKEDFFSDDLRSENGSSIADMFESRFERDMKRKQASSKKKKLSLEMTIEDDGYVIKVNKNNALNSGSLNGNGDLFNMEGDLSRVVSTIVQNELATSHSNEEEEIVLSKKMLRRITNIINGQCASNSNASSANSAETSDVIGKTEPAIDKEVMQRSIKTDKDTNPSMKVDKEVTQNMKINPAPVIGDEEQQQPIITQPSADVVVDNVIEDIDKALNEKSVSPPPVFNGNDLHQENASTELIRKKLNGTNDDALNEIESTPLQDSPSSTNVTKSDKADKEVEQKRLKQRFVRKRKRIGLDGEKFVGKRSRYQPITSLANQTIHNGIRKRWRSSSTTTNLSDNNKQQQFVGKKCGAVQNRKTNNVKRKLTSNNSNSSDSKRNAVRSNLKQFNNVDDDVHHHHNDINQFNESERELVTQFNESAGDQVSNFNQSEREQVTQFNESEREERVNEPFNVGNEFEYGLTPPTSDGIDTDSEISKIHISNVETLKDDHRNDDADDEMEEPLEEESLDKLLDDGGEELNNDSSMHELIDGAVASDGNGVVIDDRVTCGSPKIFFPEVEQHDAQALNNEVTFDGNNAQVLNESSEIEIDKELQDNVISTNTDDLHNNVAALQQVVVKKDKKKNEETMKSMPLLCVEFEDAPITPNGKRNNNLTSFGDKTLKATSEIKDAPPPNAKVQVSIKMDKNCVRNYLPNNQFDDEENQEFRDCFADSLLTNGCAAIEKHPSTSDETNLLKPPPVTVVPAASPPPIPLNDTARYDEAINMLMDTNFHSESEKEIGSKQQMNAKLSKSEVRDRNRYLKRLHNGGGNAVQSPLVSTPKSILVNKQMTPIGAQSTESLIMLRLNSQPSPVPTKEEYNNRFTKTVVFADRLNQRKSRTPRNDFPYGVYEEIKTPKSRNTRRGRPRK